MTTHFLQTERGDLIAANYVVRIGGLNSRPQFNRFWHEIDYVHGKAARSTTASQEAVADFMERCIDDP
jgi:hypothetical protein